jgi:murein DD-endopeptidase MepM/ murein hydrolase activator NlpD
MGEVTPPGGLVSISSVARRALFATIAVAATVGLVPAQAHASPEMTVVQQGQAEAEVKLAVRLAQRTQALAALNRRADARQRAIIQEKATIAAKKAILARYGYHGEPDAVDAILPLASGSYSISAGYGLTGPHWESTHGGQDFGAASGETLVAVSDATVTEVADAGAYGLRTILTLADGTEVWYCHQTTATVTVGQTVEPADVIGTVGSTGNSTGPHLHLEVRPGGGEPIDPMAWLQAAGINP